MTIILKFLLDPTPRTIQAIRLPEGAELLTVQIQGDKHQLWAKVDDSKTRIDRFVVCMFTGKFFEEGLGTYLGTTQDSDAIVRHWFEVVRLR